jgi:hypothetical protein
LKATKQALGLKALDSIFLTPKPPSACLAGWRSLNFTNNDKHLGKSAENQRAIAGWAGWPEALKRVGEYLAWMINKRRP